MVAAFSSPQQALPGSLDPTSAPRPLRDRLAVAAGRPADPSAASLTASGQAGPALVPPEGPVAAVVPLDAARAGRADRPDRIGRAEPRSAGVVLPFARPGAGGSAGPAGTGGPARSDPRARGQGAPRNPATTPAPARAGPSPGAPATIRAPPAPSGAPGAAPGSAAAPAAAGGASARAGAAAGRAAAPEPGAAETDTESNVAFSGRVHDMAAHARRHQSGRTGVRTAQDASAPDQQRDVHSQAGQIQLDEMGRQEPPPFDAAAFKAGIHAAIASMEPPGSLEIASHFAQSQQAGQVAGQLHDLAAQHETHSQQGLRSATEAEPRTEGLSPKPVTKMVNDPAAVPLPSPGAAAAIPGPRPPGMVDLSAGPAEIDARMAARGLTEDQLATSGEPSFTRVLDAREEVRAHATEAPAQYRVQEGLALGQARGDAQLSENLAHQDLRLSRGTGIHRTTLMKEAARTADQEQRDRVAGEILGIHERTRTAVEKLLNGLAHDAEMLFMSWEMVARSQFELHVAHQMNVYKAARYKGVKGFFRGLGDDLTGLPSEVNRFYEEGRAIYLAGVDVAVGYVAELIAARLNAAHQRVEQGRADVERFKAGLHGSLGQLAGATAAQLDSRFGLLESEIQSTADDLVTTVARRATESLHDLDDRIVAMKKEDEGFVSKAGDWIESTWDTITQLEDLLERVVRKGISVVATIVRHPIRFFTTLGRAVRNGLDLFVSRIGDHLMASLTTLLTGELGASGIQVPASWDAAGIFGLVLQVLELDYAHIRERLARSFGPEFVVWLERTDAVYSVLARQDLAGLWEMFQARIGDLKDLVIEKIIDYARDQIVTLGIRVIAALLLPVEGFIAACEAIYDLISFILEHLRQIAEFVDSVLDSLQAIADGDTGEAEQGIDRALAGALTIALGILARLAHLDGIGVRVHAIIEALRRPIRAVMDELFNGAAQLARRTGAAIVSRARSAAGAVRRTGREMLRGRPGRQPDVPAPSEAAPAPSALPVIKPHPEQDAPGVLKRAQQELRRRLKGHEHPDQFRAVVDDVGAELAPAGLTGLRLSGPASDGEYELFAAASPWQLLSRIRILDPTEDIRAVLRVTLHVADARTAFEESAGLRPFGETVRGGSAAERESLEHGGRALQPAPPAGRKTPMSLRPMTRRPSGGVVEQPAPGSGRLELLTFNTGERRLGTNTSHAEHQLQAFLDRNRAMAAAVTAVEATINLSPCRWCTRTLSKITKLTPGAGQRHLIWLTPWRASGRRTNATTAESLRAIQGWTLNKYDIPEESPQEIAQQEWQVAEWESVIEEAHGAHAGSALGARTP